ncbi:MAG: FAD-dependent oxidoreductase [Alphaproteobacteria bacterium]|nr:FAD-dependent oxidoreductase [Alphaproteobacteria bacterium]
MNNNVINADICVIGAGSGGLSVAAGASQMGADVVLLERGIMGGDCLNYGCVPSKALLAAGHKAEELRTSAAFGIEAADPKIDFAKVNEHVHSVIAAIEPNDSVERFESLGVRVIQEAGTFVGPREVEAGENSIHAKYFVIATGSSASVPPIPGLAETPYLTNETIFELKECPAHLVIIGGGSIGCELAQAHRRLGARVTVLEMSNVLAKDDPEAAEVVRLQLLREGVELREGVKIEGVSGSEGAISVTLGFEGETQVVEGSRLLIAAGRSPNVEGLGLEAAGISYSDKGIEVDARLRTSNKRVFAIGDVSGGLQFTHVAGYHAGIVIRNAMFKLPAKADYRAVPWVTFTDPELANVGLTEEQAKESLGDDIRILRWPFAENDRAQAERRTDGFIKVIADKKGRMHGACIVGAHAGELIFPWALAVQKRMKVGAIAGSIAPYPTIGEVSKRAAGTFFTPSLFSDRTKKIVRFLMNF